MKGKIKVTLGIALLPLMAAAGVAERLWGSRRGGASFQAAVTAHGDLRNRTLVVVDSYLRSAEAGA